jgi:RNA polymerase sigma factor (sigma-70 family)
LSLTTTASYEYAKPAWPELVERVQAGEPSAMEALYEVFATGIKLHLWRQLGGQDLNDAVHDLFIVVTEAIRNGDVRDPARLMGYVWTIVRRHVAGEIEQRVTERRSRVSAEYSPPLCDHRATPERRIMDRQMFDITLKVLKALNEREQEVILRFYLKDESPEEICAAMGLTATQYRLIKSRAKLRLGELCRRRVEPRKPRPQ